MRPLSLITVAAISVTACGGSRVAERATYQPLPELEAVYGTLITAGNRPTPDQHGTGERVGLFQDASGEVWGLPLHASTNGSILACAPAGLRKEPVTDTFAAGSAVIGATNEPTGWRGGTGDLELILRDPRGNARWKAIRGAHLSTDTACWAPESPGLEQQLRYYRVAPVATSSAGEVKSDFGTPATGHN